MSYIDLTELVSGDKVVFRNGEIGAYLSRDDDDGPFPHNIELVDSFDPWYEEGHADDGSYSFDGEESPFDVVGVSHCVESKPRPLAGASAAKLRAAVEQSLSRHLTCTKPPETPFPPSEPHQVSMPHNNPLLELAAVFDNAYQLDLRSLNGFQKFRREYPNLHKAINLLFDLYMDDQNAHKINKT